MNKVLVSSILILAGFSIVQLFLEENRTQSRKYLLAVIVLMGISPLPHLFLQLLPSSWNRIMEMLPVRHWPFLIGPTVYFYTQASIGKSWTRKNCLHFLPAFIWWVIFIIISVNDIRLKPLAGIYGFLSLISLLLYGVVIQLTLVRHTKSLRDQFSYTDVFLEMKWLSVIAAVLEGVTILISVPIALFFKFSQTKMPPVREMGGTSSFLDSINSLAILVFIFVFTLMAQKQERQNSLFEDKSLLDSKDSSPSESENFKFEELKSFMDSSKIYLDNSLSLQKLSDKSGIYRNDLSRLINNGSGENFFHFINGFRAREFRAAVKEHRYPNYNLLGIAYECGFNSKATFNTAVKRELNNTPSQIFKEIGSTL